MISDSGGVRGVIWRGIVKIRKPVRSDSSSTDRRTGFTTESDTAAVHSGSPERETVHLYRHRLTARLHRSAQSARLRRRRCKYSSTVTSPRIPRARQCCITIALRAEYNRFESRHPLGGGGRLQDDVDERIRQPPSKLKGAGLLMSRFLCEPLLPSFFQDALRFFQKPDRGMLITCTFF